MKIFIGGDHQGIGMKKALIDWLRRNRRHVEDLGTFSSKPIDYPDIAKKVVTAVLASKTKGILLCSSGVGVCAAANRFKHIRAVNAWNTAVARSSRVDDDTNILCLAADYLSVAQAKKIVTVWLGQNFSGYVRHKRRIKKIDSV
ncbi:MAG: RpiB/LacA/LacB family sugar-phosphate isomerase [Patescibacteria group bacterium]|jgi:ribose 5-phosphate isomerase B